MHAAETLRFTVYPGEDVLVPAGMKIGELRSPLATLLRRPELRNNALFVGAHPLSDLDVVGQRPLLPGTTLATSSAIPAGETPDPSWLHVPWLVARLDGPRAGAIWPIPPSADTRKHAVQVPGLGAIWISRRNRVRLLIGPGPSRGWLRGQVVRRSAEFQLLASGRPEVSLAAYWERLARLASPVTRSNLTSDGPSSGRRIDLALVIPTLVTASGGAVIAIVLGQPSFALFSLLGLLAVGPQIATEARQKKKGVPPRHIEVGRTQVSRSRRRRSDAERRPSDPRLDPARLSLAAMAAVESSAAGWQAATAACAEWRTLCEAEHTATFTPDRAVAFVGQAALARAAARAVVAERLALGAQVQVIGDERDHWAWTRWQPNSESPSGESVAVLDHPSAADLAAAAGPSAKGGCLILVLPNRHTVPTWCRDVRQVGSQTVGVSVAWAEWLARTLLAARSLDRALAASSPDAAFGVAAACGADSDPNSRRLPSAVPLAALLPTTPNWGTVANWRVPLGRGADGNVVEFDLVKDGPHLLVAGTTGAGKSELLQAFILALALVHPPTELNLALIDFKGGASFGDCLKLPHVVGLASDLDAGLAQRALAGLRAELRRRKVILADAGVSDIAQLPPDATGVGALPRLVVVFDEFRALAEELPDLIPSLLRLAAQGRSLGMHLILATQRPAGAVSPEMRANVSARIALRIVDPSDSHDVIESPLAAAIRPGLPGRAILRTGSDVPIAFQGAYAPLPASVRAAVTRAPAWHEAADPTPTDQTPQSFDLVAETVSRIRAAAKGIPPGRPPWLPPLPDVVANLGESGQVEGFADRLPFALGDFPDQQMQRVIDWSPEAGHLAVFGRARTGRSTALRALAVAALAAGRIVHVIADPPTEFAALTEHPGFGTLVPPSDLRRCVRLLDLLAQAESNGSVLVLDGIESVQAALIEIGAPGIAPALRTRGLAIAASGHSASLAGLASAFNQRLLLLSADRIEDSLLGVPNEWAGRGRVPGRGLWTERGELLECQVRWISPDADFRPICAGPARPKARDVSLGSIAGAGGLDATTSGYIARVPIGVGGDCAEPEFLDVEKGCLIVGPRGSGRTAALGTILAGLPDREHIVVLDDSGAFSTRAKERGIATAGNVAEAVRQTSRVTLLVDDLDALEQLRPDEAEQLAVAMVESQVALIAATSTMAAVIAHHGPTATLRSQRTGIVLQPTERGSDEVFAARIDPGEARLLGRGVLVRCGVATPVQVAYPGR